MKKSKSVNLPNENNSKHVKLNLNQRISGLLENASLSTSFNPEALKLAKSFGSKINLNEIKKRIDLSNLALCTIDGQTAKDFDDAVYGEKIANDFYITVAIADVSYYVKKDSILDEEAFSRGTSIYYPGSVVPMLPEHLSNGLCSLKPKLLRLAICVSFKISAKGKISKVSIREAIIKSKARLSYEQVQDFYDGKKQSFIPKNIRQSLLALKEAALLMRKNRQQRGAIDFDIIESLVSIDSDGEPISIHPEARLESHKIIEDLMVATNELVAHFFQKNKIPVIYRVHETPDEEKLERFFTSAKAFKALNPQRKLKTALFKDPKKLRELMLEYDNSKYRETLNILMLRAMMQARYSEKNLGHFGLASKAYLHFTSPIRRYADLIVHRQLRTALLEKKGNFVTEQVLGKIAQSISDKEAKATDIERKIDRLFCASFMSKKIGRVFEAEITSATEFGLFVRIIKFHIEGLIHISAISRKFVNFVPEKMALVIEGSNKQFLVGDKILVRLLRVNIERGFIDFEMVQKN